MILGEKNLYINVKKITVFQRRNNIILSTLKQRRNLKLKQYWIWVDTKKVLFLCYDIQEALYLR